MNATLRKYFHIFRALIPSAYFCLKYLPFKQAIRLPILIYKPDFQAMRGGVKIDSEAVTFGMIRLGFRTTLLYQNNGIMWSNEGLVVFKGKCKIGNNSYIVCGKNGLLEFGDNFFATGDFRIVSERGITIRENVLVGWGAIFLDTDFHPIYNISKKSFNKGYGEIEVGSGCWFAAHTMVLHSSKIPDYCVFGARSIINRSIDLKSYCLYGGSPIRLLKEGVCLDKNLRSLKYN